MNNMTTPTVPHTVIVAYQIYIQYAVPLVFAFFLRVKLTAWAERYERKRISRKRGAQGTMAVRATDGGTSGQWWVAPEMRK